MTDVTEPPIAILSSGHSITIDEVKLFPEPEVAKLSSLRAEAAKLLGGTSSGIGFIGSPTWAVGGALAIGFLESLANSSMKKQAMPILQEAEKLSNWLIESGRYFAHAEIVGIGTPVPQLWHSRVTENVSVQFRRRVESGGLFGRVVMDPEERIEERTIRYVHFEREFLEIRNTSGSIHVKWADVSAYRAGKYPPQPIPASTGTPHYTPGELAALKKAR